MARVGFLTDLHFDVHSRWDETLRIADWCVEALTAQQPAVIALGGDIFERRPCPLETRAVAEWLVRLAEIAPVVGVYGNHDVADSLAPMNLLESAYPIAIYDRPELLTRAGLKFALLPWPRKAGLLAEGAATDHETSSSAAALALRNILRGMGAYEPDCFVGHVQVRGARVSTGQPMAPGADFELGLEDIGLARARAYLFGHIHLPDTYEIAGAPALYGGSFRRTSFGELEDKSLVLADFAQPKVTIERITIPCTPMLQLGARWQAGGMVLDSPLGDVTGAEIRLRYTTPSDERETARVAAAVIRDHLMTSGALAVRLEEQPVVTSRARTPEIAAAITLNAKLEALWANQKNAPEADRRARLLSKVTEIEESAA